MKTITTTEANQNFSKATRLAEQEGSVLIDKHSEPRYVLLTIEKYTEIYKGGMNMMKDLMKGIYVKDGNLTSKLTLIENGTALEVIQTIDEAPDELVKENPDIRDLDTYAYIVAKDVEKIMDVTSEKIKVNIERLDIKKLSIMDRSGFEGNRFPEITQRVLSFIEEKKNINSVKEAEINVNIG